MPFVLWSQRVSSCRAGKQSSMSTRLPPVRDGELATADSELSAVGGFATGYAPPI